MIKSEYDEVIANQPIVIDNVSVLFTENVTAIHF